MTTGEIIYLAIILAAFLTYAVTLFWAMVTSNTASHTVEPRHPTEH